MENDNFDTYTNKNQGDCQIECEKDNLCKYVKYVPESKTCERFSSPNRVCVGYLGLPDNILKKCTGK